MLQGRVMTLGDTPPARSGEYPCRKFYGGTRSLSEIADAEVFTQPVFLLETPGVQGLVVDPQLQDVRKAICHRPDLAEFYGPDLAAVVLGLGIHEHAAERLRGFAQRKLGLETPGFSGWSLTPGC